jgi:DNA repair protein RecO (recombination protein O)
MAAEDYSEAGVRQCAKELLRTALANHLGGRPLRSRELFRKPVTTGVGTP